MPLTPADVHNVAFSKPPIGKRGYNEDEVDAFLDLVETELTRLIEENADLRQRVSELDQDLAAARAGGAAQAAPSIPAFEPAPEPVAPPPPPQPVVAVITGICGERARKKMMLTKQYAFICPSLCDNNSRTVQLTKSSCDNSCLERWNVVQAA